MRSSWSFLWKGTTPFQVTDCVFGSETTSRIHICPPLYSLTTAEFRFGCQPLNGVLTKK